MYKEKIRISTMYISHIYMFFFGILYLEAVCMFDINFSSDNETFQVSESSCHVLYSVIIRRVNKFEANARAHVDLKAPLTSADDRHPPSILAPCKLYHFTPSSGCHQ